MAGFPHETGTGWLMHKGNTTSVTISQAMHVDTRPDRFVKQLTVSAGRVSWSTECRGLCPECTFGPPMKRPRILPWTCVKLWQDVWEALCRILVLPWHAIRYGPRLRKISKSWHNPRYFTVDHRIRHTNLILPARRKGSISWTWSKQHVTIFWTTFTDWLSSKQNLVMFWLDDFHIELFDEAVPMLDEEHHKWNTERSAAVPKSSGFSILAICSLKNFTLGSEFDMRPDRNCQWSTLGIARCHGFGGGEKDNRKVWWLECIADARKDS